MRFVGEVVLAAVLVFGLLVGLALLFRRRILAWAESRLTGVAGGAIVDSLPPRVVLTRLFDRIYGAGGGHIPLQVGILGGAGRDLQGRDIAASRATSLDIRLVAVDSEVFSATLTWTHQLSGVLDSYRFVAFASSDANLWNAIPTARRSPLYESWYVEEDRLDEFVESVRSSTEIGIVYRDHADSLHTVELCRVDGMEPRRRHYADYIAVQDETVIEHLRVVEFDLGQLVDPDHIVEAVESLTVRASSLVTIVDGFLNWSPPFPCRLERVTFDLSESSRFSHQRMLFRTVTSTPTLLDTTSSRWGGSEDVKELLVGSWLLPGHSVGLQWRPDQRRGEE